jgi:hypothetical protein
VAKRKPKPFSDSFTTSEASFIVEVKRRRNERVEAVKVEIDCGGAVHVDEVTIDLFIEILENARANLVARRGIGAK